MFNVKDKIFYPHHGAGEVEKIEEIEVLGEKRLYYVVKFPLTETLIKIPADNIDELGMRYLADAKEIKRCFEIIAKGTSDADEDWKVRYKKHQEMLKSGFLSDIAEVIRNLYDRNQVKELSSTEKKLYHSAIDMVVSEVSLSLNKDKDEVKAEVMRLLEGRP
jgi:CarD family transcriptional regulator